MLLDNESMAKIKANKLIIQHFFEEKQTRNPNSKEGTTRAKKTLELIHIDVCGPLSITSLLGTKYFLFLIDDYFRKL